MFIQVNLSEETDLVLGSALAMPGLLAALLSLLSCGAGIRRILIIDKTT